ncbi:MAG: phage tail protein [Tannerellaceae bacterium]|jgi:hypothetical protein|nr:phage tail protein [Tannerellaceae bacterium]
MKIYDLNNEEIIDVVVDDKSYRVKETMGDNKLLLFFALPFPLDLPLYNWCEFKGERYFLMNEENFKKIHTENHKFTLEMDTYAAYLKTQKFEFFTVQRYQGVETINSDREIEFTLHLTPREYVQLLVDNMNQKDAEKGWAVGDVIEGVPTLLDFNDVYCFDALLMFADAFKTECEVDVKTIHLRKVEKEKDNPLPLAYGKDEGLLSGVGRTNYKGRIAAVRVKTSDRNIDRAAYGSKTLRMPKNHTIVYEGVEYVTDATGSVLKRKTPLVNAPIQPEETLDLTSIYPHRVGTISTVIAVDDEKALYDFTDTNNPIDYSACIIPGETMTVIFQDGKIAGTELDVTYIPQGSRFELVPLTEHGVNIPQGTLIPAAGDKYAVFHISLPEEYITAAELEVLTEAAKFLHENENPQFTYTARLDENFAKRRWLDIGGYFNPGYFIRLTDPQYLASPVDIRIVAVKDFVNSPQSPEITLSNSVTGKSLSSIINQLPNQEQVIDRKKEEVIRYSKLRFRDVMELAVRLQGAFTNFTEGISPVTVHAMMQFLGDASLQFCWVDDKTTPEEIDHSFVYNPATKVFSTPAGIIQHMTLGIDSLAPSHDVSEYKFWDIAAYTSPPLADNGALWLYLKCQRNGTNGVFLLSENIIEMEADPSYYHFLTGHLNSEFDGSRNFVTLYGFSQWTPGAMRVNKIINIDGSQFWDMLNKRFRIGNNNSFLSWNVDEENQLVLKGTLVQSPAGDIDYLGVDRGNYVSGTTYYPGDMVKYAANGNIYKCIQQTTTIPTTAANWKLMVTKGDTGATGAAGSPGAAGAAGVEGQGYLYAYYPSDSLTPPATPTSPGNIPSGWFSYPTFNNYRYIYISQCIKTNGSWGGWTSPRIFSVMPEDGDPGPAIVFRGDFAAGSVYYNNAARRDVVKYSGTYYIYKGGDGATNSSWALGNWESFGAQFSSVATDLLLAVNANVGGWIFKNERLESQSGGAYLDGKTGTVSIAGKFTTGGSGNRIEIDPSTRSIKMINSNNGDVAVISFEDISGMQSSPRIDLYRRNSDGSTYTKTAITPEGLFTFAASGALLSSIKAGSIILKSLSTIGTGLEPGTVWRDGNTLKVVT